MRRALPAVLSALACLLLTPSLVVQAGTPIISDGFEKGLGGWNVIAPAGATVAARPRAARRGDLGLLVASDRGILASATRSLPEALVVTRVALDVRRDSHHSARIVTLRGRDGSLLSASVTRGGRLDLAGVGWRKETGIRIPDDRWVRLALVADQADRRVKVLINGKVRLEIRRATGRTRSVRLAGGPGPRVLSVDRFVLSGRTAPTEPPPDPDPEPTPTPSPDDVYRFTGRGSDHGVGMSQIGAVGRALAGQGHKGILAHYYQDTVLETRPAVENRTVRVLIMEGAKASPSSPLLVCGRHGKWTLAGSDLQFPGGSCAHFAGGDEGAGVEVFDSGGTSLYAGPGDDRTAQPVGENTLLEVPARGTRNRFRGELRVRISGKRAKVVNQLPMGDYLRGVVPLEMSPSRPGAALRAQAVAARSYAMTKLRPSEYLFDLHDDSRHQVYGGALVEAAGSDAAVADTAGKVVTYNGRIATTLYHAHGGGATEDARNVFTSWNGSVGSDTPYLRGSLDVDGEGQPYDATVPSSYGSWATGSFTLAQLTKIMAADTRTSVGPLRKLVLKDRGVSGRLISVTLVAEDGTRAKVAGWLFKSVYNDNRKGGAPLLSTLFFLEQVP